MRLLFCCLFSLCLLASSGIQSVQGRLGDVKQTVLEETDEPTVDPTVYPTEIETDEPTVDPTIYPTEFVPIPVIMGDGNGAACEPYHLFGGQQICEFQFCDGGSVTINQCGDNFSGDTMYGTPSCNSGQGSDLALYLNNNYVTSASTTGPCGCPQIVYELASGCNTYQIIQTCTGGECSGTTVVYATPTGTIVNGDIGGACDAFTIDYNNNWQPVVCEFDVCSGGTFTISQCSMTGSLGLATCSGSETTILELYQDSSFLGSSGTSSCNCPKIIQTLSAGCTRYSVVQSCTSYGMDCSGVTVIAPYSSNDAEPTDDDNIAVGTFVTATGAGGICDYFSIDQYSDQAVACQFEACAPFVITQCPDDGFVSDGSSIPHPYGSSNSRIDLYSMDDPSTLLSWDQISGPCGSPKLSYTPTQPGCITYKVRQTCGNGATNCDGRTAIYTPSTSTTIVIDASTGGTCEEFALHHINGWEPAYCEFEACDGETVVMTQCPPAGACSNGVDLTLMDGTMVIKSATDGACGCPKIVHTFNDLGGMCHTYRVRQQGIYPELDVQGRTLIHLLTGTDDDAVTDNDDAVVGTIVTAAGPGGVCASFDFDDQNVDQDVACHFEACAPFVITQCTEDGFESNGVSIPHPYGSINNRIELYSMNDPATMLAFDESSGPCNAPKISFTPTETGCITYKIRQACSSGNTNCDGRTAIYTPTVSSAIVASVGGACEAFSVDSNNFWEPVLCELEACPGDIVTISQCVVGDPSVTSCSGNTHLYLMYDTTELAMNGGAPCGCPKITYTFTESCRTYTIKQTCSSPETDCSGRTAVAAYTISDDDTSYAYDDDGDDDWQFDDTVNYIDATGIGAVCDPFDLNTGAGSAVCMFHSCGGTVKMSQCPQDYSGAGIPSCVGDTTLKLFRGQDLMAEDPSGTGACGCAEIEYTFPYVCRDYRILQACTDSSTGCSGVTAVFTTATPPLDVDSTDGGICSMFQVNAGMKEDTSCNFTSCGGTVTITQCDTDYAGPGQPICWGNTQLSFFAPGGELLSSDENGGACGCSEIVYTLPNVCQTYEIVQGCEADGPDCSGRTAVFTTPVVYVNSGGGGQCDSFYITDGGTQICEMYSCGGAVTISQCGEDYGGFGIPTCSGNTLLELYLPGDGTLAVEAGNGVCGCSSIEYVLPSVCQTYRVIQSCANGELACSGTTAVWTSAVIDLEDTDSVCEPFAVVSGVGQVSCWFRSCGGSVSISQCEADYLGNGSPPSCTSDTRLELYLDGSLVDSDEGGAICGCSGMLVDLDDTQCHIYEIKQTCGNGATDCAGVTGISLVSNGNDVDDPPPVRTSDGVGAVCEPFIVSPQNFISFYMCEFQSCGGSVTISQCADEYTGSGQPRCGGGSTLELYYQESFLDSATSWDGTGPCDCPTLVYTFPDTECLVYRLKQSCSFGYCDGTTAVFSTPTITAPLSSDGVGGVCPPFAYSGGVVVGDSYTCTFESCGGPVTVSQCAAGYTGTGSPSCSGDTKLELYVDGALVGSDEDNGLCGCSTILYAGGAEGVCKTLSVLQYCATGVDDCSGTTAVFETPVDNSPIDVDNGGGLCDPFSTTDGSVQSCEFEACGGSVTITMCAEAYQGNGGSPTSSGNTLLELHILDGGYLLGNLNGGTCIYSEIVYTLPNVCQTYEIVQGCANDDLTCSGTTAVFTTPIDADGDGAICTPFAVVEEVGERVCEFKSCGADIVVTQCPDGYLGAGTPTCAPDTRLELFFEGEMLNFDEGPGACGCPTISFYSFDDTCHYYQVKQKCKAGVDNCSGTTAVFAIPPPEDDDFPVSTKVYAAGAGGVCDFFMVSDRNGPAAVICPFEACGGSVTITQCDEGYTGSGTPSCEESPSRLELYDGTTLLVADDTSGSCGCPSITYTFSAGCKEYKAKQVCRANEANCRGTTAIYTTPVVIMPVVSPTPAPATRIKVDNGGGLCDPFSTTDGSVQSCEFEACGGSLTITMCAAAYQGTGTPTCSGNTLLELYILDGSILTSDANGGACDCSEIEYTLPETCQVYEIVQGCSFDDLTCSGTTAVFTTPIDADEGEGGLCRPFEVIDGVGEKICEFKSCGAEVVVTQCPTGYMGAGTPTCEFDTKLEVYLDGSVIASDESGGTCGCSTVIFQASNIDCFYYQVKQTCAAGVTSCAGTTAVYTIVDNTDDDWVPGPVGTKVFAAGAGEVCDSFIIESTGAYDYFICPFEACGGSVTISQCPEDYTGVGTPACDASHTNLELYFNNTYLAYDEGNTGPCGCPFITYTLPDGCNEYTVWQFCDWGFDCSGTTAIFTTPATASPVASPTSFPTSYVAAPVAPPTSFPTSFSPVSHTYTVRNGFAFAVPTSAGDLFTLGEAPHGGLMPGDVDFNSFASPVNYIVASRFAFVAVLKDQTYVSWGAASSLIGIAVHDIRGLVANEAAFAGINVATGGVFAMGSKHNGGNVLDNARCNGFATQLSSTVLRVVASSCSFTAIKFDGSVYTWGNTHCGGGISSDTRTDLVNVQKVFATREAFAAILPGGVVKTWGGAYAGGDSASVASALSSAEVEAVFAGRSVFVAHTATGGLIAWGYGPHGGDLSAVQANVNSDVVDVAFTFTACAALKSNGDVYVWGRADSGGDASSVAGGLHNIVSVHGNSKAFAAITTTGSVVAWGKAEFGGAIPAGKLTDLSGGVVAIYHTDRAFAALKDNGQLVVWGQAGHGGSPGSTIEALLLSGVYAVYSNDVAFAAVKEDGSVVAWGHPVSVPAPGVQLVSELLAIP